MTTPGEQDVFTALRSLVPRFEAVPVPEKPKAGGKPARQPQRRPVPRTVPSDPTQAELVARQRLNAALRELFPNLPREEQLRRFIQLIGGSTAPVEELKRAEPVVFFKKVEAATQDEQVRRCPLTGFITTAIFQYPAGPSYLVETRILLRDGRADRQIIPSEEGTFINVDATTVSLPLLVPVRLGQDLVCQWYNYDGGFPHRIPVILTISEAPNG